MPESMLEQAYSLLAESGYSLTDPQREALLHHCALVRKWNDYVSLVSTGDLAKLEDLHLTEALSMVPLVAEALTNGFTLVDLGTGGGYPALPLKIALSELPMVLVERSVKKVGALRNMITALGLRDVQIVHGAFPAVCSLPERVVVTARAIEKPRAVNEALALALPAGGVFWCPSGETAAFSGPRFSVSEWRDAWTEQGLRRGSLHRVERVG